MARDPAHDLADRLTRPRRVGLFGRRGVGKTTFLAMLYREATAGRLPGLRLAAADARTAEYLGDKVRQLEAGQPLPATLAQTELRFNLYRGDARVELVLLDYQGEHVEVGRAEPARDFLRGCDAVLICLHGCDGETWHAEQEVEQMVEDYLAAQDADRPHRPMAVVRMKADRPGSEAEDFALTRHALTTHVPDRAAFAVASLRHLGGLTQLAPEGLDGPLVWLADALHRTDAARLAHLFRTCDDVPLLRRALASFRRSYPSDPLGPELAPAVRRDWRRWRRVAAGVAAGFVAIGLAWAYDARGAAHVAAEDARLAGDPVAARAAWRAYARWYPTRFVFGTGNPGRAREVEFAAAVAGLGRRAEDADADPEALGQELAALRGAHPDLDGGDDLIASLRRRADARREGRGRAALAALTRHEATADLPALAERAGRLAGEYAGLPVAAAFRERADGYLARIDARDFQAARDFSARSPHDFPARRQRFQAYLDRHPRGRYADHARAEAERVGREWDRADYRKVREPFAAGAADLDELRALARAYLMAHPGGRFRDPVTGLLRWCDQVSEPGEYRVKLVSGVFDRKAAFWASRGVSPSVTIEVGGVTYGPGPILKNDYAPRWDHEFPRRVRWKSGDAVRVIVKDHYFWRRTVADLTFDGPTAMARLNDLIEFKNGSVRFESDFTLPDLPRAD